MGIVSIIFLLKNIDVAQVSLFLGMAANILDIYVSIKKISD